MNLQVQTHKALNSNADTKTINIPLAPVVNALADAVSINEGAVGIALNGVEIYGPYNADTCCDFAADSLEKVDFCMGYSSATYPSYRSRSSQGQSHGQSQGQVYVYLRVFHF